MASTKGLTQAEIDVKLARMDLEKTIIRAPFAGIVTDIKISPKERLDAGRELFTLVDISRIKVKAKVLESEIGKMQPAAKSSSASAPIPARSSRASSKRSARSSTPRTRPAPSTSP